MPIHKLLTFVSIGLMTGELIGRTSCLVTEQHGLKGEIELVPLPRMIGIWIDSANKLISPLPETIEADYQGARPYTMPDIYNRQAQLMTWVGITYDYQIAQLTFGLILKWSDGSMALSRHTTTPSVPRKV